MDRIQTFRLFVHRKKKLENLRFHLDGCHQIELLEGLFHLNQLPASLHVQNKRAQCKKTVYMKTKTKVIARKKVRKNRSRSMKSPEQFVIIYKSGYSLWSFTKGESKRYICHRSINSWVKNNKGFGQAQTTGHKNNTYIIKRMPKEALANTT